MEMPFLHSFLIPISKGLARMAFAYYPIYFRLKKSKKIQKICWYADVENVNRLPNADQYFLKQINFDSTFFNKKLIKFYEKVSNPRNI